VTGARIRIAVGVLLLAAAGVGVWFWMHRNRESTDDAQVDAHVTPIAARVGGAVASIGVVENQPVKAGDVLVQIDTRDFEVALARARAELADAEATAQAASVNVPIAATTTQSNVASAQSGVEQSASGVTEAEQAIAGAQARVVTAQARVRELEASAANAARDVERLKGLLAKDEIPQQQYDTAVAAADSSRAAVDSARAQVHEAEVGIKAAESRLASAHVHAQQTDAELRTAQTAPQQVQAIRARAASAAAQVEQKRALVKQAELNLEYAVLKAPVTGIVSRKSVEPGQVIQAGQPLMTIIPLENVWITANFKETQLANMRVGQRVTVEVDAYGGRTYEGKIDSIAAATGSRFSLLPPENASGNFVKVVQRVPVKIVLDEGQDKERLLRPGMSVTPTVYTK
jgi:membrane fusion protein (multidrug efflux system)